MEINTYFYLFDISFHRGVPWYLILEDDRDDYPRSFNCGFFEVVESTMPNNWRFYNRTIDGHSLPCITTKEWAYGSHFYEYLIDCKKYAVKKFAKQKKIADNEIKKFLSLERFVC